MKATPDPLADRINDVLSPVHRGVIRIADEKRFIVFGNDGYSDPGTRRIVTRLVRRLDRQGYGVEQLVTNANGYTWALVLAPDSMTSDFSGRQDGISSLLWRVWKKTPSNGRTSADAGSYQRSVACAELNAIGGGYHDRELTRPLAGKGGPVRGVSFINSLLLARSEGQEVVHVLIAGIPYPARICPVTHGAAIPIEGQHVEVEMAVAVEMVVTLEAIGDPRSESHDVATAFIPKGAPIPVTDTRTRHEVTGRRVMMPADPLTAEPLQYL